MLSPRSAREAAQQFEVNAVTERFAAHCEMLVDRWATTGVTPGRERMTSLLVHRVTPNQPATVPLVIVDGCGEWPTLVGGGPGAF